MAVGAEVWGQMHEYCECVAQQRLEEGFVAQELDPIYDGFTTTSPKAPAGLDLDNFQGLNLDNMQVVSLVGLCGFRQWLDQTEQAMRAKIAANDQLIDAAELRVQAVEQQQGGG